MNPIQVYREIEGMFGIVPTFIRAIPEPSLEAEWKALRRAQFDPGPIPNKYRELIGVAVAAAMRCAYGSCFHKELAELNGATEAEIRDAVRLAQNTAGWSTWMHGLQLDLEQFREEVHQITRNIEVSEVGRRI